MVVATISSPEFKAKVATSLPKGIDLDRFTRMTMTAIQSKPELLEADKDSLYLAILQCAQTGLSPDGKESALVVFNTKVGNNQWVKKVQFMPMVTGIIKKLGEVGVKCDTNVVYENDLFDYEAGDDERITHKPAKLGTDRGLMIGCYAILRVQGIDTPYREVMSSADVEAVRRQSRAPDSLMWTQFASEGYRKTVLRRCAKRIPMKFEESLEATLNADNETFDMTPQAATEAAPAAAEAPQPAQIEQVNQQTDDRVVASQTPPEAAKRSRKTPAPAAPEPVAAAEESENPAPREERRAPEPAAPAPAAANTRAPAQPARPAALAAVVDATDDNEDIF
jgi:recombination protein RecT